MFKNFSLLSSWKNLHVNVYIISFTLVVNLVFLFSWWAILPLYFRQLGANDFQIALSYSVTGISYTLFQFAGGILGDRLGRKFIIVATTLLSVPLYIIAALSGNWILFLIILAAGEGLNALQAPCFISIIGESTEESSQGKAFSLFEAGITLGLLLGPAAGAVLLKFTSVPVLIIASGIICLFTALIRLKYLKETVHSASRTFEWAGFKGIKNYLNSNLLWLIAGLGFLSMIVSLTIYGPFLATFAKDTYSLDKSQINLMFALGALLAVVFAPVSGGLVDKFGLRSFLIIGALFHTFILLLWTRAYCTHAVFIIFAFSGIPLEIAFIAKSKLLIVFTPGKHRSTLIGFIGAATGIMGACSPLLAKLCQSFLGHPSPFILAFFFAIIAGICLMQVDLKDYRPLYFNNTK